MKGRRKRARARASSWAPRQAPEPREGSEGSCDSESAWGSSSWNQKHEEGAVTYGSRAWFCFGFSKSNTEQDEERSPGKTYLVSEELPSAPSHMSLPRRELRIRDTRLGGWCWREGGRPGSGGFLRSGVRGAVGWSACLERGLLVGSL